MTGIIKTTEKFKQRIYCITLSLILSYSSITNCINIIFNRVFNTGTTLDTMFCYMCLWGLIFSTALFIYKHIKKDISLLFIGLMVAWFISYGFLVGTDKPELFFTAWRDIDANPFYILFVYAFFGYVIIRYVTDYDMLIKTFAGFSVAVVLCSTLSFFLTLSSNFQEQYMVFSYNMTLQSVFIFLYYFEKRNPWHLAFGILGFIMILMAGCRGAIVCVLGCVLVYAFFGRVKMLRKIILIIALLIATFFVFVNFYDILDYLIQLADRWNMSSRTIMMIQKGEFFNDSGRGKVQEQIIENLDIWGYGLYGENAILKQGGYAHQLFLSLLCHYGYILGGFLSIVIAVYIIRGLSTKNSKIRFLVIVMMSTGFFKLFLSGSYLHQEPAFYVLLGLCVNSVMERKKKR